jgi:hypothetical protein
VGASAIYDRVIPATLSVFDYSFARTVASLNRNEEDPTDTYYAYSYALPNDYLAFVSFGECNPNFYYKIMGSDIWTNQSPLSITYKYAADISLFPSEFCLYLVYLMCSHLAYPITGKPEMMAAWQKIAADYYAIAASSISSNEPSKVILHSPLLSAFHGG